MRTKRQLTGAALTANIIKKRLVALYPSVKFSVRSDVFANGNSVDIRWTDGPRTEDVNEITKQYQYGDFDSMTDSYNYKRIDQSLGCEGAKYVHCNRTLSPEHKEKLVAKASEIYGIMNPNDNSYYRRLADVEKEFFPYTEVKNKPSAVIAQGNSIISGLEINIIKDVDTRDKSEIYVVKVITRVENFRSLKSEIKFLGGYYSRFKNGFIFKEDPTKKLQSDMATAS